VFALFLTEIALSGVLVSQKVSNVFYKALHTNTLPGTNMTVNNCLLSKGLIKISTEASYGEAILHQALCNLHK
jgi:hypothetical protein